MPKYSRPALEIPLRDEAMLIPTIVSKEAGLIVGTYDMLAPGLYPDEELFLLDESLVALKVETHWLENGQGIAFHALARAIEDDGSSKLSAEDQQIKAGFSMTVPAAQVLKYGVDAVATDVARVVLGEDPQIMEDVFMGEETESKKIPLLDLSSDVRANADIRAQLILVDQVRRPPKLSL